MLRWKLLHFILPCKVLLFQWKISSDAACNYCNRIENYEHFFISCTYLQEFWNKMYTMCDILGLGRHIFSLKNMIWGYKIQQKGYEDVNCFLTILLFTIYKAYYISDQKTRMINVFNLFKNEINQSILLEKAVRKSCPLLLIKIQSICQGNP